MPQRLRWGVLGTGNIARQFAEGVQGAQRSELAAVGSRTQAAADAFAKTHHIPRTHGGYQALIDDPAIDAVYVALPNSMHGDWTTRALTAGRHVLCEKPLAVTASEAERMFAAADRAGRLLVEAYMYRCHPVTHAVLAAVRSGKIGRLRLIRASFCFRTTNPGNIRFSQPLAGGALMDVGCYCVDFARLIAGAEPLAAHAVAHVHDTDVDDLIAGSLLFPGGVAASFTCGMQVQAGNAATICGDGGYIEIPVPWKPPMTGATYAIDYSVPPKMDGGGSPPGRQTFRVDADRPVYALEADALAACVLDGAPPAVSRADSIANMRVLDELRIKAGLPRPVSSTA